MQNFLSIILFIFSFNAFSTDYLVKVNTRQAKSLENFQYKKQIRSDVFLVSKKDLSQWKDLKATTHIEPNRKLYLLNQPNDLDQRQWWLKSNNGTDINPFPAWKKTTGSKDVIVAVIDTGIDYKHSDLKNNLWRNIAEVDGEAGVDDDGNGFIDDFYGWNFPGNNNDISDVQGHGTHVAGIIGAEGNNGIGITGVNWNVQLMGLNMFPRFGSEATTADAIGAIDYAVANGAQIINASWGGGPNDYEEEEFLLLKESIQRAGDSGVLFVAAAGNDGASNENSGMIPASYDLDSLLAVGSSTKRGRRSGFSNYGLTSVDVFAPGSNIYSTIRRNRYGTKSGTSMAAPVVSGIAALMLANEPQLSIAEIKKRMISSCVPTQTLKSRCVCGGIVDAEKALQ